jgi:hypothetical protein
MQGGINLVVSPVAIIRWKFPIQDSKPSNSPFFVGTLSPFLELPTIVLSETATQLETVEVNAPRSGISQQLDKKTYTVADNISQSGGSALQQMQALPGVTVQDGKVLLRGNEKSLF